ncbi:hypothetical protein ES708_21833 [subsurface metagenome]
MVQSNFKPFQDMSPSLSLFKLKPRAPRDNLTTEIYIILKRFFKANYPGLTIHQSQHVNGES